MRTSDLLGATALGLLLATSAGAQETNTAAAQDTAAVENLETDNAGDIVVTASKRETTLQDTPISVSVTSEETIERAQVRDLLDLQTLVPSLKVNQLQSSANTNFVIRGFGNGANNAGIEPSVGVFVDGVYRSRSAAQIADLPNVRRVEVLRGPQSTLFGKNASAGIISIVTAEPAFELGGEAEVSYGNYDAIILRGNVTGPLTETIAFSIAGNLNKRDGYGRDLNLGTRTNNRDRWGVRGQLLLEPSDTFKLRLIGDYDRIDEVCCTVANLVDGPTGGAVRALGGRINSNNPFSYDSFGNFESVNKISNYGGSAQADWEFTDTLSLTSITAYRKVDIFTNQDVDFTSADIVGDNRNSTDIKTFTQELRIASDFDGPLNFLLGGFFFKEDIDVAAQLTFGRDFRGYANLLSGGAYSSVEPLLRSLNPGLPAGAFGAQGQGRFERYDYKNEAFSIFGQVDFELLEGLTLTAGFNYTDDSKRVRTNNTTTDVFSSIDLVASGVPLVTQGAIATTVGTALGLGGQASAAQIAAFAAAQPAVFAQIQAGAAAFARSPTGLAANPLLGLRPLQFLPPFLNFPNAVENGRTDDQDLSYTFRLAYKFNPNLSGYATYATGFKASSFNLSTDSRPTSADFIPGSPVTNPPASPIRAAGLAVVNLTTGTRFAGPEEAELYEIGLKGSFGGFGFNFALFKQILTGFQSNIFQGTGFVLGNAEKQSTQGFELDTTISPVDDLRFFASVTYLDSRFDRFTGGSAFNPATNTVVPTDLSGRRNAGVSDWSVSVGGDYTERLAGDNALLFHVDYAFSSAFQIAEGLRFTAAPESLNASLGLQLSNGLILSVWGRNLTEPRFNGTIFPSVAQAGSLSAYPSPPRTYGVSARFSF